MSAPKLVHLGGTVACKTCGAVQRDVVPTETHPDERRVLGNEVESFTACTLCAHMMVINIHTGKVRDLTRQEAQRFYDDKAVWDNYKRFIEALHKEKRLWG